MAVPQHRLEQRASSLGRLMKRRVEIYRAAIAPSGERLPFTQQLSKPEALSFWQQHRYDQTGAQVIASWPDDVRDQRVMELDAALAQQNANRRALDMANGGGLGDAMEQAGG